MHRHQQSNEGASCWRSYTCCMHMYCLCVYVNARSITNCISKLFAVLQALHFTEAEYLADCRACHALSELTPQHPLNTMPAGSGRNGNGKMDLSWPFFCVSISFTKEAIVAVRTGELNVYCNSLGVLETLHAFHKVSNRVE